MEYVFIPLDKIKIVEKFIDDYPIYLDFKSFVKNKDEKLYKKLPLYLVCEEKIINKISDGLIGLALRDYKDGTAEIFEKELEKKINKAIRRK